LLARDERQKLQGLGQQPALEKVLKIVMRV
jgi:hypothetical protein